MASHRFSSVSEEEPCCDISRKTKICLCVFFGLLIAVVIAVPVGVLMWPRPHKEWKGEGTTAHFYEILLGRCYTYTQIVRPELGHKDCQKIGKAFTGAFLSKDPCSSTEQDYKPLMELTDQAVPCDKTLLWSKSSQLAHDYTRVRQAMFTLEDTLLGYMADGLRWCGDSGSSDMNYKSCPNWREDCSNNSFSVFWNTVSKRFAEDACGVVHVVLNGSISNTFDERSTFGRVEVFNLRPEKVHRLQAWVMHDIGSARSDSCSSSSINVLKRILKERSIAFSCENNYGLEDQATSQQSVLVGRALDLYTRWPVSLGMPRTVPMLARTIPHLGNPFSPRQMGQLVILIRSRSPNSVIQVV